MKELLRRNLPTMIVAITAAWVQWRLAGRLGRTGFFTNHPARQAALRVVAVALVVWTLILPFIFGTRIHMQMPANGAQWAVAVTLLWLATAYAAAAAAMLSERAVSSPSRRKAVKVASGAIVALPVLMAGAGMVRARSKPEQRVVEVRVAGLHPDLDGLRIAQLTDIHYGPFYSMRDLEWAVAMANEMKPHMVAITGDLISHRHDNLEECMWVLKALKSDLGVFGCHGNHEIYAGAEDEATAMGEAAGIRYLRGETAGVQVGRARLNVAGVDYQRQGQPYLEGAHSFVEPGALNLLLSHNPDVFEQSADYGFDLTLSGHTHGGQVNVEILSEHLNVARFFTPYVYGLYRRGGRSIYVSGGLGTVGVPVRLGAPPEVTLVKLCAD